MPNEPQSYGKTDDVPDVQASDEKRRDARAFEDEDTAVKGVSSQEKGAKRSSFFKDRDYRA